MKSVFFCFPREIQIFPLEPFATWLSIPRKIGKPRLVPHNWRSLFFNASIKSVAVRLLDWNKFNFPTFFFYPPRNLPQPELSLSQPEHAGPGTAGFPQPYITQIAGRVSDPLDVWSVRWQQQQQWQRQRPVSFSRRRYTGEKKHTSFNAIY